VAIDPDFYDAELRWYDEHFRAAADVRRDDHVLDVGCGGGQTTRHAARTAVAGSALGVDPSAPMLRHARRRSEAEGLRNVGYLQADAGTHPFAAGTFDLCISRFGTMFFADPVAAFANVGRALRPGARLVMLVWQGRDHNEWATAISRALGPGRTPHRPAAGPDPFSLADPAVTQDVLTAAGFTGIGVTDVHQPVFYGPDVESALDATLDLYQATDLLAGLDAAARDHAVRTLRTALDAHDTDDGVLFDSRAWLVTATRAPHDREARVGA
jgi:SAM-dependent methyltransferase